MRFLTTLLALFLAVPTLSAPSPLLDVEQSAGPAVHGRYIVKLKNGASKAKIFKQLRNSNVTHDWNVIHGFAGQLDEDAVDVLRASPDVDYIAQDAIMHTLELATHFANFVHKYNTTGGKGVDIYIVGAQPSLSRR
ncbi:hypothetical protein H0H81_004022 [Sphagnurus paluster]|uniref:Inhibitor I9 domain-containing protein n=1 Tax=Sphagnurus paluster TaxID=117069 RepID=A0A9P7KK40_9AGAR|nr:hypothetical protein H0H81_004022 [Sphagnurus paluster]